MVKLPDFLKQFLLRPPSDTINAVLLAANTAESITIPAGATCCILSGDQNFYVKTGATATVPTDTTDGSASELNMVGLVLQDPITGVTITTLSVISESAAHITASFYN